MLITSSSDKVYVLQNTYLIFMQGRDHLKAGIALSDNFAESKSRTEIDPITRFNAQYVADYEGTFWGANGFFTRMLRFLPFFSWVNNNQTRNDQPPSVRISKPGIFSYRIVFDAIFLKWLGYLDAAPADGDDFDPTPGLTNEYTNTGILSALLLTVWVTFKQMTDLDFENDSIEAAYNVFWNFAVILALLATLLSVLMLLKVSETSGVEEAKHFVEILDYDTFGLGSHCPVIFLYFSLCCALFGFIIWLAVVHGDTSHSFLISVVCLFLSLMMFGIFILFGVRALYISRHTQAKIQTMKKPQLTVSDIKQKLEDCIKENCLFENIASETDFLTFLKTTVDKDTGISYQESYCDTTLEIAKRIFKNRIKYISA